VQVLRHIASHPRRFASPVLTLGNFDGVHRGHQAILGRVVAEARRLGGEALAITFAPHPLAVLRPGQAPPVLTSLHDRLGLIAALGVDAVVLLRFTPAFARLAPEEFVDRFLVARLGAVKLIVGHRVSFGHERRGNAALLETLGRTRGFAVEVIGPVEIDGREVSSSAIRAAVVAGDVRLAAALLGRPHRLSGRVVRGHRRGASLGFPTANVRVRDGMHPREGVYAVVAEVEGARHPGVANLGRNPTFGGGSLTLEVHLLGFDGDLYGRRCAVSFVERLRDEMAFPSAEALAGQIRRDAERARAVLAERG
jgi:riboflavin kinase/FMN adenylyltransferase